jgi:hypothetical protein
MATGFDYAIMENLLGMTKWSPYKPSFVIFPTSLSNGEKTGYFTKVAKRTREYYLGTVITEVERISMSDYQLMNLGK